MTQNHASTASSLAAGQSQPGGGSPAAAPSTWRESDRDVSGGRGRFVPLGSDAARLYVECGGDPGAPALLYLHGGPERALDLNANGSSRRS